MLADSYKMIGTCIDNVSKAVSQIERARFNHADLHREKDFLSHTMNSLKLDNQTLRDNQQSLLADNMELGRRRSPVKRVSAFKQALASKQEACDLQATEKAEGEERARAIQAKLDRSAKEAEQAARTNADLVLKARFASEENEALALRVDRLEKEAAGQRTGEPQSSSDDEVARLRAEIAELKKRNEADGLKANQLEADVKAAQAENEASKQDAKIAKEESKVLRDQLKKLETEKKEQSQGSHTFELSAFEDNYMQRVPTQFRAEILAHVETLRDQGLSPVQDGSQVFLCPVEQGKFKGTGLVIRYAGHYKGHLGNISEAGVGSAYYGSLCRDKSEGRGTAFYSEGDRYEGDFIRGMVHGRGVILAHNGHRYEGEFIKQRYQGRGVYSFSDGGRYEGDFFEGRFQGRGVYFFSNGDRYEGDFFEGLEHGRGVLLYSDGRRYEGQYCEGMRHGNGTLFMVDGTVEDLVFNMGNAISRKPK